MTFEDDEFGDGPRQMHVPLPLGPKVAAKWGDVVSVSALPMKPGSLRRLLLASPVARFYMIENVTVAGDPLLHGPVGGDIFTAEAHTPQMVANYEGGKFITLTARAVKPPPAKIFAIAWWVRWFTREGWRDRTPRKPPPFQACLICSVVE